MMKHVLIAWCAAATVAIAETTPLAVGETIPKGTCVTVANEAFDLLAAAKKQPIAIIYYRGGWCPYCTRHLSQLQQLDPKLRALGYEIIAISPDTPEHVQKVFDEGALTYTLLSDSSMETAKAFGIAFEVDKPMLEKLESYNIDIEAASGETHHLLPVPSVFLVGTDGVIDFVHSDPDYTKRIDDGALLHAAEAAAKK